jgi:hypothetical protein
MPELNLEPSRRLLNFTRLHVWPFLMRYVWPALRFCLQQIVKWWTRKLPPNFHSSEYGGTDPPPRLMLRPAYTILPFIRWPLGYHVVHPFQVIFGALVLSVGAQFFWFFFVGITRIEFPRNFGHEYLVAFSIVYASLSFLLFLWRVFRPGVHTAEAGYSWLARLLPLPLWTTEMFLVPAIVAWLGYLISLGASAELGWYLMLCALSLMLMATWEAKRRASQKRTTVDDLIRARTFETRMEAHDTTHGTPADKPDVAELG